MAPLTLESALRMVGSSKAPGPTLPINIDVAIQAFRKQFTLSLAPVMRLIPSRRPLHEPGRPQRRCGKVR
jgi:hypothetical protein